MTDFNGPFKKRNDKQRKQSHLLKDWCQSSRHLKALPQTSRTCISKETLKHAHPWTRFLRDPFHGSLAWQWRKVVAPFLQGYKGEAQRNHSNFIYRRGSYPPNGFIFYLEFKREGRAVPGFSWGCLLQVQSSWSMVSSALVFAESEQDLKYASSVNKQKAGMKTR